MSDFKFNCPHCNQSLEAPGELPGQTIECPSCRGQIQLPKPTPVAKQAQRITPQRQRVEANNPPSLSPQAASRLDPLAPMYTMKGAGAEMVVFADKLEITPRGLLGFISKGIKGTKTIPFHSISAIQFKKPGLVNGYLQFSILGGNESRDGVFDAAVDENTFMFAGQTELAIKIKTFIEARIQELRRPQQANTSTSLAGELERLGMLRQEGILSDQEFQEAKSRLLR